MIAVPIIAWLAPLVPFATQDPAVLVIDGQEMRRSAYADRLLRARGELYAPDFVRLWRLRRLGAEHGISFAPPRCRDLARLEADRRIEGAFHGERELWLEELRGEERSPAGWLAQRALAIEGEELLAELEREGGQSRRELLDGVNRPFEFHPASLQEAGTDAVLLTIDGSSLTRDDYLPWLLAAFGELDARRMAETVRIEHAAHAEEIQVTPEEVRARSLADLEVEIEHDHRGDRSAWRKELALTGRNHEQFMRELEIRKRHDLLVEELLLRERVVSEDELRSAWQERHGTDGRTIELRWIRIDAQSAAELEAARLEAADLRRRLGEGEDFATLAELHSDDAVTRARGGRPTQGFRLAHLPAPLAAAVRALAAGDVSDPLPHEQSVWLFEVTAIRVTPFDDVRTGLLEELRTRRPTEVELATKRIQLTRDVDVAVLPAMFAD